MLTSEEIQASVRRIATEVRAAYVEMRAARGLSGMWRAANLVIHNVEKIAAERKIISLDKKLIAVEAICLLVPDQWVPDSFVRVVAGFLVERALKKAGI